jgi:hypothetical protein
VEVVLLDREEPGELARALRLGADALIDMIAFGREHARQLIEVQDGVGTLVVISSASVYCDALGKTLDEARQSGFPDRPVPIPETQPTVIPVPPPTRRERLLSNALCLIIPKRPSRSFALAKSMDRVLDLHGNGGSSNVSSTAARSYRLLIEAQADSTQRLSPKSPPGRASSSMNQQLGCARALPSI